ncbi:MAG: hypothetical protein C0598_03400 [Marinilabiliales bacterium]|nr:MAG: hypothetical protein C0598_03400 [Marinilabiliales bacterium]
MRSKINLLLLLLLSSQILFSQNVECFILDAPEKPFYNVKKIGVFDIKCDNNYRLNNVVTNYLIADLLNQYRGIYDEGNKYFGLVKGDNGRTFVKGVKTDFYQVIERDQLEKVMKEQRLSLSGAIDENSAAEVGRVLGLDVIIMGSVSYTSNDERGTSLLGLASSTNSNCLKRTVTVKGTMKMVSVETAQIIGTKTTEYSNSIQKCDDQKSGIPRAEDMAESYMKVIARRFANYFAPGYRYMNYEFEKIHLKEFRKKSKEAFGLIENGDLDRAFPTVYAMFEADSYNPKAAYNLAIIYEMVGAYEDALHYYKIAYELDYTNDKYSDAVKRAESGLALNAYLEDIGRPVQSYSFTSGNADLALADKLEIKGNSGDRVEVLEFPEKGAKVLAKVPGGLEFKIIEKNGSFYKIQLRGTKTGFVHKSDVKL